MSQTDVALYVAIETGLGLPGLPGLPAAPAAALASRFVSAPAATRPLGTAGECVLARTVRRGNAHLYVLIGLHDFIKVHTCSNLVCQSAHVKGMNTKQPWLGSMTF